MDYEKSHRTYWLKKEISAESVKTTHRDYFLVDFFSDLNDVFEYLFAEGREQFNYDWDRNAKHLIYRLLVNIGPNRKDTTTVAREMEIPLEIVEGMAKMYWYEIELFQAIFEREVEYIKRLAPEDQMPAFEQLCSIVNNGNGKFL